MLDGAGSEWNEHSHGLRTSLALLACPVLASVTAGSALDLAAGRVRTCVARPVTVPDIPQPCLRVSLHFHIPSSFYVDIFLCPSLPSPSHQTSLQCVHYDLTLIILCQREKIFSLFFLFPLYLMLSLLLSFINLMLLFPVSPDLSTLLPLKLITFTC